MVEQTQQAYEYVSDNPVNGRDPGGEIFIGALGQGNGFNCPAAPGLPVCYATYGGHPSWIGAVLPWSGHNIGTIVQVGTAGACIFLSGGACLFVVGISYVAQMSVLGWHHDLLSVNGLETTLLALTSATTAGTSMLIEDIGARAGIALSPAVRALVTKALATIQAIPYFTIALAKG
jgi:hypothetical protein